MQYMLTLSSLIDPKAAQNKHYTKYKHNNKNTPSEKSNLLHK